MTGLHHNSLKAIVEEAVKEGKMDPVLKDASNIKFLYTVEHIHQLLEILERPKWSDIYKNVEVITINNLKGGTGKSTTTINMATALALDLELRARVLVIDLDPQGSLEKYTGHDLDFDASILTSVDLMLGDREEGSVYQNYINQGLSHEDIVKGSLISTHLPNLKILPSHPDDDRYNEEIMINIIDELRENPDLNPNKFNSMLREKIIDVVKDDFDFIFIDTTPQRNFLVKTALEACTGLLVPCTPHDMDWKATQKHIRNLENVVINDIPDKGLRINWLKVIPTNLEKTFDRDKIIHNRMKNALGSALIKSPILQSHAFEVASQQKVTVNDIAGSTKLVPVKQLKSAKDSLELSTEELLDVVRAAKLDNGEYIGESNVVNRGRV